MNTKLSDKWIAVLRCYADAERNGEAQPTLRQIEDAVEGVQAISSADYIRRGLVERGFLERGPSSRWRLTEYAWRFIGGAKASTKLVGKAKKLAGSMREEGFTGMAEQLDRWAISA